MTFSAFTWIIVSIFHPNLYHWHFTFWKTIHALACISMLKNDVHRDNPQGKHATYTTSERAKQAPEKLHPQINNLSWAHSFGSGIPPLQFHRKNPQIYWNHVPFSRSTNARVCVYVYTYTFSNCYGAGVRDS